MVHFLKQNPFLHVILFFIPGIWAGFNNTWLGYHALLILLCLTFATYSIFLFYNQFNRQYGNRWVHGFLFYIFAALAGMFMASASLPPQISNSGKINLQAKVLDIVGHSSNFSRAQLQVTQCSNLEILADEKIELLGYLPKILMDVNNLPGKTIVATGTLAPHDSSMIPYQFDYGKYLYINGYSGRFFVSEFKVVENEAFVLSDINVIRVKFQTIFKSIFADSDVNGVMQSLVLGDRGELRSDIRQQYVESGAIHILAVSGMHVGILYLFMMWLLGWMNGRWGRLLKVVIVLATMWFYAWLTMLAPSILRATIMFSLIIVGKEFNRNASGYNILAASAFIILAINPLALFNAGFWLSHLAVLGIFAFYKTINNLFYFTFIGWRWLWSIVAVSMAAQITTFPLTMMMFNGLPIYFLLTNILILPVVSVMFVGGLVLMFLPTESMISTLISEPIGDMVIYMNGVVEVVSTLPGAYWTGYSLTFIEMILMFGSILMLYQYFHQKRPHFMLLSQSLILIFLISLGIRLTIASQQATINIYSKSGKSIINVIDGSNNYVIHSSNTNSKEIEYLFKGFWNACFLSNPMCYNLDSIKQNRQLIRLKSQRIDIAMSTSGSYENGNDTADVNKADAIICFGKNPPSSARGETEIIWIPNRNQYHKYDLAMTGNILNMNLINFHQIVIE